MDASVTTLETVNVTSVEAAVAPFPNVWLTLSVFQDTDREICAWLEIASSSIATIDRTIDERSKNRCGRLFIERFSILGVMRLSTTKRNDIRSRRHCVD